MNKEQFLALFFKQADLEILKLYNLYEKSSSRGIGLYSEEFYPPSVWKSLEKLATKNLSIESYGIFEDCDRRIIAFNKFEWDEYPIKLVEIKCNTKFSTVEHKDFLGAIMALGIKRDKIGDLILKEDGICYLATFDKLATFIVDNLHKIKKLSCECKVIDYPLEIPKIDFKEEIINAASKRLDSVVAALANISRSKSSELISKGLVLVDYIEVTDKSYEVDDNSRITIRKVGKFRIKETFGTTKSGRLKITVLKYA